jgi:POT family proton-dependent oligopeptide transporter
VLAQKAMKNNKEIFGHPRGLFVLFFTEMWERFSYYGMRALLVLYMTQYLFLQPEKAETVLGFTGLKSFLENVFGPLTTQALSSQIYGLYTGLVYFTPFFGGIIADRLIGQKKSVYVGGILMAIGHFLMASEQLFFPALLFLIFGNGFFKPNISTQVGNLYAEGDTRRDRAFTLFYMGINLGAFFSPLVCGTLGQKVGWHYGFGAAGIGMLVGLLIYHFGRHELPNEDVHAKAVAAGGDQKISRADWIKIWALVYLCFVNILFWGVFEQQGNTLQLWADRNTDWNLLGFEIPSTWFQSFNPFIIFAMAPIVNIFWGWQAKRKKEPSSIAKMAIGCVFAGLAFLFMVITARVIGPTGKGNFMWLFSATFLFTMGELYLSPIGLSLVTKVSPSKIVSMMMGMWLLSSFFGNYFSGYIGSFYDTMPQESFFLIIACMAFLGAFLFVIALKPLKKIIVH